MLPEETKVVELEAGQQGWRLPGDLLPGWPSSVAGLPAGSQADVYTAAAGYYFELN